MKSKLEQTWWFVGLMGGLSALVTIHVMRTAGIWAPANFAQWILYFFCFVGIHRCISFLGWGVVLLVAPKSPLLKS